MALNFPNSPVIGEALDDGTTKWTWDGSVWNLVEGGATGPTPWARVSLTAAINLPNTTQTAIPWNLVEGDASMSGIGGANPSRLLANSDGKYLITTTVRTNSANTGGGIFTVWIRVNGSAARYGTTELSQTGSNADTISTAAVLDLTAGDYVDIVIYQNSGAGTFTIDANNIVTYITNATITQLNGGGGGGGSDGYTFMQEATPTATTDGQTWFNISTGESFVWYDSYWIQTSPGGGGSGAGNGVVVYATKTTDTTNITSAVDVLSVAFDAQLGRTYKTTMYFQCYSPVATDSVIATITDAANVSKQSGTVYAGRANEGRSLTASIIETGLSGTITRKLRAQVAGTGPAVVQGASTVPVLLIVEDITFGSGGGLDVTPWTNVTYQNSWVDYNTAAYGPTQYRRVGDMVQIRGLIKSGADGTVAFTLPVGFRPNFPRYGAANDTGTTPVYGTCVIGENGTVTIINKGTISNGIDVRAEYSISP